MKGANEYYDLFKTGQYGRLYFCTREHARGKTFNIFILPDGEQAKPNGDNAPLNSNAVEVYGVISGNPGWTEKYGWLHKGKWQDDFEALVEDKKNELEHKKNKARSAKNQRNDEETQHKAMLLSAYE